MMVDTARDDRTQEASEHSVVERVARAMFENQHKRRALPPSQQAWQVTGAEWIANARVAIAAMREPTEEMLEAAVETGSLSNDQYEITPDHFLTPWQAMIDEALKE